MSRVSACRVCLSSELNMYAIADTPLQAVYEKLTGRKLQSADARPACVCYICLHQLRKCDSFIRRAVKADTLLTEMINTNSKITSETLLTIDRISSNLNWRLEITKLDVNIMNIEAAYEIELNIDPSEVKLEPEVVDVDIKQECVKCEFVNYEEIDNSDTKKRKLNTKNGAKTAESKESQANDKSEQKPNINSGDLKKHTSGKPFKCEHCGLCFKSHKNFLIHIRNHTSEKSHKCEYCNYAFLSIRNLKLHQKRQHQIKRSRKVKKLERPYVCEYCSFAFKQKINLIVHIRKHTGEKPYHCDLCSFKSGSKSNLVNHIRTHTGERRYKCEVCSSCFMDSSQVRVHMRVHTGEKPYKCEHCSFSCSVAWNLKRHTRSHTGERPYQCTHCSSSFSCTGTLNRHIRTHTGEKPYKCDHCNYCTTSSSHLTKHMMRIHKTIHSKKQKLPPVKVKGTL